jgi:hypothetical protein
MKIGAKDSRKGLCLRLHHSVWVRFVAVTMASLALLPACGRSDDSEDAQEAGETGGEGIQSSMRGVAAFGTQCSAGFATDPKAVRLELWSCPLDVPVVELAEPIQPLYFQADCVRKNLTIRSHDRTIDATWELWPDGSFRITQEGLKAKLKNDGSGASCVTPLSADLWGKVECVGPKRDQARIRFETVMWLGKGAALSPTAGAQCRLPAGNKCYFHAITSLDQCI